MQQALIGRVVIVTGAGRGLGRVMALALLRAGARVVLTATDGLSLADTIRESGVRPDQAVSVTADLTVPEDLSRIVRSANHAFGRVDVLVNNAGLGPNTIRPDFLGQPVPFWEIEPGTLRRFFEINSMAPHILAGLVVSSMRERGWGRIINVTTSLDTMLRITAYGASKAALEAQTASMATDLAGTGVTANVLVPGGPAATRMTRSLSTPPDRLIQPGVMAAPVVWLASNASNGVTARRFVAARWDPSLPADQAAQAASAPVAWTGFGHQAIYAPTSPGE
jgi:NAD(P)-dependent dehydrogenase (short-subunit alcohol dehydrogenase family)